MNGVSSAALEHYERKVAGLRETMRARGPDAMAELEAYLARSRRSLLRELTVLLADAAPALPMEDADLWTVGKRTAANLAAMQLLARKAPLAMTVDDRLVLARYSGFGGLSIDKIKDQIPASLEVDTRELVHAYYTPTVLVQEIARAVQPLLAGLVGVDGIIRAMEPSAGIGRFIRAFDNLPGRPTIRWTAVEYSALAAALLAAVRPGLTLYVGPFERWIREHGADQGAGMNLVVSNPPFGERGLAQFEDPDRTYREKSAASYFVRRGLGLLVPGGLGIYIIPKGFLSDPRQKRLRELVLLQHHLISAFRLPSHVRTDDGRERAMFHGAHNIVDLLFFRRRHGELAAIDPADLAILEGRYFEEVPRHVLGEFEGEGSRWARLVGPPVHLPSLIERPMCSDCKIRPAPVASPGAIEETSSTEDPRVSSARVLARRVDAYLAAVATGRGEDPVHLWPELHGSLLDWRQQFGSPYEPKNLVALAQDRDVSAGFLRAFDPSGRLIPALLAAPTRQDPYRGTQGDPVALAEHLYRQERGLSIPRLLQVMREQQSPLGREEALDLLYRADWCVDGPGLALLVPTADYLTGDLWARLDALDAQREHPRAQLQSQRLLAAIGPALLGDLGEYSAREGWIPLDLRAEFINAELGQDSRPITLEREEGLITPRGIEYDDLADKEAVVHAEAIAFLGWTNHDFAVFRPKRGKGQSLLEAREERQLEWSERFRRFVADSEDRTARLLRAYNRQIRGFLVPTYSEDPLAIARWTRDPKKQLHDYQRGGVRRIVDNRGGILSYDVGVGKTFTALAAVAILRQQGVIRRPVVLVPNSLVFQWFAEVSQVLPDYRVAIIGAKFVVRSRGDRRGETDSETDSPEERAAKWTRFQGGEYDLVLLTYSSLGRTRIDFTAAGAFAGDAPGAGRQIALRRRTLAKKKREARTERENAILDEGTPAWIREFLELPESWEYDGQVVWDDLGIDFLVIDEMHNFKNLFMPEPRERGLPAFMGSGGEGSGRAWQLFFRCAAIRARTGGAGILGLTATIAKNGPTELYTAFSYINPASWSRLGITDAEQFIDQFCLLEPKPVVTTAMKLEIRDAMVGFKNITDLRAIFTRFVEFRGASELARLGKLRKPTASVELVRVRMNDTQRARMQAIVDSTRQQIQRSLGEGEPAKQDKEDEEVSGPNLGTIVKMGLIAIHPQLVDGYTPETALEGGRVDGELLPRPDYHSPKFDAVAEHIVAKGTCGHIVFIEPIVAQIWMREVLVAYGVPRERVALLNAHFAKSVVQRQDIARDFNNGKYLVVIANAVAGEGANLQRRTCAVHNVDIPWDPMTRRQRNGRADRQGNEQDAIIIYDYLTMNSGDGPRFDKMAGKGTWIEQILESKDDVAINPASQVTISPIELLADLTDDPEEARRLYQDITAQAERERSKKLLARIARLMRATDERFRAAERAHDPIEAARLRGLGQNMLDGLRQFDPAVWPFADAAQRMAQEPIAVHDAAIPLYSGARVWGRSGGKEIWFEVGRVDPGGLLAVRAPGEASWEEVAVRKLPKLEVTAGAFTGPWPDEEAQLREAVARALASVRTHHDWRALAWTWASEAWLMRWWPEFEPALRERLAILRHVWETPVPTEIGEDTLYLAPVANLAGTTLLPPSAAGWERFVRLAQLSDYPQSDLRAAARAWWDRPLPTPRAAAAVAEAAVDAKYTAAEAEVIRDARARGLDESGQERYLALAHRARKYMGAAAVLLRRRGVAAVFGPRLKDGLTLSRGGQQHFKSTAFAFGGPPDEPASRPLGRMSVQATQDVLSAVALEDFAHGDQAIDVVLENLIDDPAHYDDLFKPAEPVPPPPPQSPSPPAPPRVAATSTPAPGRTVSIVATRHSKHHHPIWVAKLDSRATEEEFAALRGLAGELGGHYSTYQSATVPRGFVFGSAASAQAFAERVGGRPPAGAVPSSAASPTTEPAPAASVTLDAPAKPGHHYIIGDKVFADEALLRVLQARFPFEQHHADFAQVTLPAGKLNVQRFSDERYLPDQDGPLYGLLTSNPPIDVRATVADFAQRGLSVLRCSSPTWDEATRRDEPAPTPPPTTPGQTEGRFWRVGDLWFGDTALISRLGSAEHAGFGDFNVRLPGGKLLFIRVDDRPRLPGQSGRIHRLHFDGRHDIADELASLAAAGRADAGGTWNTWGDVPRTPSTP